MIGMTQTASLMRHRHPRSRLSALGIAALTACTVLAACSTSAGSGNGSTSSGSFYHGKTVELLVPNAPGGNIDVTARITAPYLAQYLGASAVKVVDVTGAGGVVGLDQLWNSPKNGLTVGYTNVPVSLLTGVVGGSSISYVPGQFVYLGRLTAEPRLLVVSSKSNITSASQLRGRTIKIPIQGFDDSFYTLAALGHSLGFKPEFVTGFASLAAQTESLGTGSTDLEEASLASLAPSISAGLVRPLLIETSGPKPASLQQYPTWASVATQDTGLVSAFVSLIGIEGSFFVPPGTPTAAVSALRSAIGRMASDPGFKTKAAKVGTDVDFMSGTAEQAAIEKLLSEEKPYTPTLRSDKASVAG